ncbi:hypothetical protein AMS68_006173 [Peltaster fructicola]|uniref:1-phosphatidylinositol-4-phosphate 5-kinase n=1 Tax=Peltaster fructicola TaxID=286661 RepID=A0A6H0Y146_9PEZI|nr:hypothetical protein AMS68_006173 [Peltaster fructicola]
MNSRSARSPSWSAVSIPKRPQRLVHRHTLDTGNTNSYVVSETADIYSLSESDAGYLTNIMAQGNVRISPVSPTKPRGSLHLTRSRTTRNLTMDGTGATSQEIQPDEDASRWTEHIKAKRASKKNQLATEDENVAIGTRVDENHRNWVMAFVMLSGIRHSVSRVSAKVDRDLTSADFDAKHKNAFNIAGYELTPSSKYDFKFKDYAPWVFRHIRAAFRIDPADYLVSLTAKYILSELGSPGKSGSFFYYSRDYKYIIKTIHHSEAKVLLKILPDYYKHVIDNPNTLLSQFYGLHRVKLPYGRKVHFVVMNNLFPLHREIHERYDLKGSTVGRETLKEGIDVTYKDVNWTHREKRLQFGNLKRTAFLTQLDKDVNLLQRLNLMDYSLLVGVHDASRGNDQRLLNKTLKVFHPGGEEGEAANNGSTTRDSKSEDSDVRSRNLRNLVNRERPVPIGDINEIPVDDSRRGFYFYRDDGGFRSTDEHNQLDQEIYYLGIIDCLTPWSTLKKVENMWKGLRANVMEISPIRPVWYGERFSKFIHQQTTVDWTVRKKQQ